MGQRFNKTGNCQQFYIILTVISVYMTVEIGMWG